MPVIIGADYAGQVVDLCRGGANGKLACIWDTRPAIDAGVVKLANTLGLGPSA